MMQVWQAVSILSELPAGAEIMDVRGRELLEIEEDESDFIILLKFSGDNGKA